MYDSRASEFKQPRADAARRGGAAAFPCPGSRRAAVEGDRSRRARRRFAAKGRARAYFLRVSLTRANGFSVPFSTLSSRQSHASAFSS